MKYEEEEEEKYCIKGKIREKRRRRNRKNCILKFRFDPF